MKISKIHLEHFLLDSTLNNFIHDLLLLEDNFGINFVPSPSDDHRLLSQLQQAWTNISTRIRNKHRHAHEFLTTYTDILDRDEFAPTFLASTRILSSKIDHLHYIKTIFSNAILLTDSTTRTPFPPTSQFSPRSTDHINCLTITLFNFINTQDHHRH